MRVAKFDGMFSKRQIGASQAKRAPVQLAHRPDYVISVLVLCLIAIGMVMIYSTGWIAILKQTGGSNDTNSLFYGQLVTFVIGILLWYLTSKVHYSVWQKYAAYIFYGSAVLMFLVLIPGIGVQVNGAARWVHFGPINFQPVEFFKLGIVLYMAAWVEKNRDHLNSFFEGLVPFMIIISLTAFLVVLLQKDMGSAMVIVAACLSMYFVSGVRLPIFAAGVGILAGLSTLLIVLFPYRLSRFITFLNHTNDTSGSAYHINQALIALGSGGILGRGLGKSLQAYGYLPESTNDSIFAIIGEEFGFLGCLVVVSLYGGLLYRGYRVSRFAPDNFAKLVAVGITAWIGFQAIFNMTAMIGLIPLTGITLPFISYGGTSLIALLIGVGILQNISKFTHKEVRSEDRSVGRGDRRTYRANFGGSRAAAKTRT